MCYGSAQLFSFFFLQAAARSTKAKTQLEEDHRLLELPWYHISQVQDAMKDPEKLLAVNRILAGLEQHPLHFVKNVMLTLFDNSLRPRLYPYQYST